jgi:hypothetical protein
MILVGGCGLPDLVMMINYPYYKPINTKGVITRQFMSQDIINLYLTSVSVVAAEVGAGTQYDSRPAPKPPSTGDGLVSVTVPTYTAVVTESASGSYRVS